MLKKQKKSQERPQWTDEEEKECELPPSSCNFSSTLTTCPRTCEQLDRHLSPAPAELQSVLISAFGHSDRDPPINANIFQRTVSCAGRRDPFRHA